MGLILQGKSTFISQGGLNQLNNFIFVLAIMQIVYSVLTMALGRAKVCASLNKILLFPPHSLLLSVLGSQLYPWCFTALIAFCYDAIVFMAFMHTPCPMGHNTKLKIAAYGGWFCAALLNAANSESSMLSISQSGQSTIIGRFQKRKR